MRSSRPKPLHHLCGRPMVHLRARRRRPGRACERRVVVVGHGANWVETSLKERSRDRRRTQLRRAVRAAGDGPRRHRSRCPTISDEIGDTDGDVLILPGRHAAAAPRARSPTSSRAHRASQAALTVLTRRGRRPVRLRPHRAREGRRRSRGSSKNATPATRRGRSPRSTPSIMVVRGSLLGPALRLVGRQNSQNEYYLTDLVGVAARHRATSRRRSSLDDAERGVGRERPRPARRGRGRAARADQRALDDDRGDHVGPRLDLRRRRRRSSQPDVSLLPGHDPEGALRRRARRPDRSERDPRRTCHVGENAVRRHRRGGRGDASATTRCVEVLRGPRTGARTSTPARSSRSFDYRTR